MVTLYPLHHPLVRCRIRGVAWACPIALLAVLASTVPSARLLAQTSPDRVNLERFRDSLAATVDSTGLLGLEQRMIEVVKADRNNALGHLRLGFLSLRLGDLGGQAHYDDA